MAQTASGDTRVKAFGLAAHLTLEALIDHLIASGILRPSRSADRLPRSVAEMRYS